MTDNPQEILQKFKLELVKRSFSGRNLHLGKMFNCRACRVRHRTSQKCEGNYVKTASQDTLKGIYGASGVKGKRIKPHPSKRALKLLELTRILFEDYKDFYPEESAMKMARHKANCQLRKTRTNLSSLKAAQQHVSRHINRGLLVGGARA